MTRQFAFSLACVASLFCMSLMANTITYTATAQLNIDAASFTPNFTSHQWDDAKKMGTIVFDDDVVAIGDYAFEDCEALTTMMMPNTVVSIGKSAFSYCANLTYILLSSSLTTIGYNAFNRCSSLASIDIPNTVTFIDENAFASCIGLPVENHVRYADTYVVGVDDKTLTSYTLKDGTKWIGSLAFYICENLESIEIPTSVISIGSSAFGSCRSLDSINLPNSVTYIGNSAFSSCDSLRFILLPDSITYLGSYAFNNCISLSSLVLPNTITEVEKYLFAGCAKLESVVLPSSIITLKDGAFEECAQLADIYSYATTPPAASSYTFNHVNKHCYIHVPYGTVRQYQYAQGWRDFYHIYEISMLPSGADSTQVSVTVSDHYAVFAWPIHPTASSYTLEISKGGELFCTLVFNPMGQLIGMSFAPGRGTSDASAQSGTYGYSFVVTGLADNTVYDYTFTTLDGVGGVLAMRQGSFSTSTTPTALETYPSTKTPRSVCNKFIFRGNARIARDGRLFTWMGQEL